MPLGTAASAKWIFLYLWGQKNAWATYDQTITELNNIALMYDSFGPKPANVGPASMDKP